MGQVAVIIVAAGKSERFGGNEKKIFAKVDGQPLFLKSIGQFINRPDVSQTILVVSPSDLEEVKTKYGANLGFMGVQLVGGGETRTDSVANGLAAVKEEAELIAIHDAARPCVTEGMIDSVFAEAAKSGAAILAAPLRGTVKKVSGANVIDQTISREGLWEAQTPQVFRRALIIEAYQSRDPQSMVTDDAQLLENAGHPVSVVESDFTNLKITTRPDITMANSIVKSRPQAKPKGPLGAFDEAQW